MRQHAVWANDDRDTWSGVIEIGYQALKETLLKVFQVYYVYANFYILIRNISPKIRFEGCNQQ